MVIIILCVCVSCRYFPTEPPYFVDSPGRIMVDEGGNVEIVCEARGYPPPTVQLLRNRDVLTLTDHRYQLVSVTEFELGDYLCSASNTIVNPPMGKHRRVVNKRVTVEFNRPPVQDDSEK